MSHIPVNHHLRPLYRAVATLIAIFLVVFGLIGALQSADGDLFGRDDIHALGLRTNLAFSVGSIAAGVLILLAILVGRSLYPAMGVWGGSVFMVVGLAMLALMHTDLNVLNFSMANVIVSFIIGILLFSAGLYGKSSKVKLTPAAH